MIEEFFGVKFLKTKYSALDGFTTVSFEEQSEVENKFKVMASQKGIWFEGRLEKKISSMGELQDWAKLVSMAWAEHSKLMPKITQSFSGH
jgi:hypothetical protein